MKCKSDEFDSQVGVQIKARRKLLGFSPKHFASLIGVSCQQLYKYENGTNRVSASQMARIASILGVPVTYFLQAPMALLPHLKPDSFRAGEVLNAPETYNLVKNYIMISDVRTRHAIGELVASITKHYSRKV